MAERNATNPSSVRGGVSARRVNPVWLAGEASSRKRGVGDLKRSEPKPGLYFHSKPLHLFWQRAQPRIMSKSSSSGSLRCNHTRIQHGLDESDLSQMQRESGSKLCLRVAQPVYGHEIVDAQAMTVTKRGPLFRRCGRL